MCFCGLCCSHYTLSIWALLSDPINHLSYLPPNPLLPYQLHYIIFILRWSSELRGPQTPSETCQAQYFQATSIPQEPTCPNRLSSRRWKKDICRETNFVNKKFDWINMNMGYRLLVSFSYTQTHTRLAIVILMEKDDKKEKIYYLYSKMCTLVLVFYIKITYKWSSVFQFRIYWNWHKHGMEKGYLNRSFIYIFVCITNDWPERGVERKGKTYLMENWNK